MHTQYGALADKHRDNGDYRPVMSQIIHDYLFRCPSRRIAHLLQVTTCSHTNLITTSDVAESASAIPLPEIYTIH
jgi:hypothetical protein